MTRWDWTWEERSPASRASTVETAPADEEPPGAEGVAGEEQGRLGRERVFRRRRAGAGVALILILVIVLSLTAALAHKGTSRPHSAAPSRHVVRLSPSRAEVAASDAKAESRAIRSVLAYTPFVRSGGARGHEVALTFDDGPGPYTRQLVATLNRLHVKATFFAIGSQERYFSAGTVAEVGSGDVVGDHTESHPMMASLSPHDQYEQLFDQMAQVEVLGAKRPRLFRPPYGSFDATTFKELHHLHLLMVLWSVDTRDYTRPGVRAIVRSALEGAKPGAIVLMHDGGGDRSQTIAALPGIVSGLRRRGLEPVTVPKLLEDDPPPHGLPVPTSLAGD